MCYQESRRHAFCNHTITARVPCSTPISCPQSRGEAAIDILETQVTTHCHRCQATVDNLGVKAMAQRRSHKKQHSEQAPKKLSDNKKRWSPRPTADPTASTTTTTTTTMMMKTPPHRLASSTSMGNLKKRSSSTTMTVSTMTSPRATTTVTAPLKATPKAGRGTPGRVLHPAASMGDLRQRARAASDSVSMLPPPSSSSCSASSFTGCSLTGRKASMGEIMRQLVDEQQYQEWEAADAKPWSLFDLMVSPTPPPKQHPLGSLTDSCGTEPETTPKPPPVASPTWTTWTMTTATTASESVPESSTTRSRSGSSPPGPTYSFMPKIRPPPADLAPHHRPPKELTNININATTNITNNNTDTTTSTTSSTPNAIPLSPLKSPKSFLQSLGLRKTKKPPSFSLYPQQQQHQQQQQQPHHHHFKSSSLSSPKWIHHHHHHHKDPVSPVVASPPPRPPRSPPLPPVSSSLTTTTTTTTATRYSSLLDKPLPPPPLDLEGHHHQYHQPHHHHQTRRSEDGPWSATHHDLRWDAHDIKVVRATV